MGKWLTYWFCIEDVDSDLCGEEFFVEVDVPLEQAEKEAMRIAQENFPNEKIECYGRVSEMEAEIMGLDTY